MVRKRWTTESFAGGSGRKRHCAGGRERPGEKIRGRAVSQSPAADSSTTRGRGGETVDDGREMPETIGYGYGPLQPPLLEINFKNSHGWPDLKYWYNMETALEPGEKEEKPGGDEEGRQRRLEGQRRRQFVYYLLCRYPNKIVFEVFCCSHIWEDNRFSFCRFVFASCELTGYTVF